MIPRVKFYRHGSGSRVTFQLLTLVQDVIDRSRLPFCAPNHGCHISLLSHYMLQIFLAKGPGSFGIYSTTLTANRALDIASEHISSGTDNPLFLYLAFQVSPHARTPSFPIFCCIEQRPR